MESLSGRRWKNFFSLDYSNQSEHDEKDKLQFILINTINIKTIKKSLIFKLFQVLLMLFQKLFHIM